MWQYYLFVCLFLICLFIERPLSNPPAPSAGYFPPSSGTSYKCSWRHFHKPPPLSGHDLGRTPARLSIFLQYSVLKSVYHLKEILAKFTGNRNRDSIFWWGGHVTHAAPLIRSLRTLWKIATESWWQRRRYLATFYFLPSTVLVPNKVKPEGRWLWFTESPYNIPHP